MFISHDFHNFVEIVNAFAVESSTTMDVKKNSYAFVGTTDNSCVYIGSESHPDMKNLIDGEDVMLSVGMFDTPDSFFRKLRNGEVSISTPGWFYVEFVKKESSRENPIVIIRL